MEEIWKDIAGFEGLYQVSSMGRIKSLICRCGKEKILKPIFYNNGYLMVTLCKDKKHFNKTIHSLVWDEFGDSPRNGRILQVDHINNCKIDNRIENLQLLSSRENNSKKINENKTVEYNRQLAD